MGSKLFEARLRGPGFLLGVWVCTHDHHHPGDEQRADCPIVNVVLQGVFVRHVGRRALLADPTVALVAAAGEGWRSSHPEGTCGDAGVFAMLDPDLGPRSAERVRPLDGRTWHAWGTAARTRDVELATSLVADVIDGSELPTREPWYVARARRLLAAHLRDPPPLAVLADQLRVSPWHLCRTFRAATGTTPRSYVERLRLATAVRRIEAGCPDLASLALELGFSSHSHLTARYRAVLGTTPRGARS